VSKDAPVIERKTRFDGRVQEFACRALLLEPGRRAVLRYDLDRDWTVDGLALPRGGVTAAHYWLDRPYNVYHWLDPAGRTLGWYCNVGLTDTIAEGTVAWRDLVVDVLIRPDGAISVLDEDELPADLAPEHRRTIARALEQLVTDPRRLTREIEQETRRLL
jgi:predicted RNA-binding protein associated with RNAse of E/G family